MITRCVVAALNAGGEPDLFFVKVQCSTEQYENGEHYTAANRAAEDQGYEPSRAFDEDDPGGRAMMPLFVWGSASTVRIGDDPDARERVVIEVSGGLVTAVHLSDPSIEVSLFDWDNIRADEPSARQHQEEAFEEAIAKAPHTINL